MHAFLLSTAVTFVAELGDKTMLATITLATTEGWLGTWIGSTLGMVLADLPEVAHASALARHKRALEVCSKLLAMDATTRRRDHVTTRRRTKLLGFSRDVSSGAQFDSPRGAASRRGDSPVIRSCEANA